MTLDLEAFGPCAYPLAVEVGEVFSGNNEREIVVSTESGQMVWFPESVMLTGNLVANARAGSWVVAGWGMTVGPQGKLQVVDQTARRWQVDPASGAATFLETMPTIGGTEPSPKPFRDLAYVGYSPTGGPGLTSPPHQVLPMPGTDRFLLESSTHCAVIDPPLGPLPFFLPPGWSPAPPATSKWEAHAHYQVYSAKYLPFAFGGDSMAIGTTEYSYWWSSYPLAGYT